MVADALQALGNHQHIQSILAIDVSLGDLIDEHAHDAVQKIVQHLVGLDDLMGKLAIGLHEGVDAFAQHLLGVLQHGEQEVRFGIQPATQVTGDLGDHEGLVADALQVGNHLQRRGNLAEVGRNGLLLQQQAQAHGFDVAFDAVDTVVHRRNAVFGHTVFVGHALERQGNGFLAHRAHLDELLVELFQLFVVQIAH